ncbi:MAG: hypothetical protein JSS66_01665 [Armatimonadetes bacterium]|nr:hypothetical protein [Armatimonadota bacterium]
MNKLALTFLALAIAPFCPASDVVWSNVSNLPSDLMSTGDGWSATRAEDVGSYRIAADDFVLTAPTRVTSLTYYSVQVGTPVILGGDLYVYTYNAGHPGTLVTAQANLPLAHTDTGWFNTVFMSNVYENVMRPVDLVLPAGHYFLAFRTVESRIGGQKNGALTTRVALGTARANWNFDVAVDGTVNDVWMTMDAFNGVLNQEWSFVLRGQSLVRPTSFTVNLGRLNSGDVASLGDIDGNVLQVCKFIVPNQTAAPVTVQLDGSASFTTCSSISFAMTSRMSHSGVYGQTLDLWDWTTGNWDPANRSDAVNTSFATRELQGQGNVQRFVRQSDGAVRARYRVRQTGPGSVAIWCHEVDRALWYASP